MKKPIQVLHLISSSAFLGAERVVSEIAREINADRVSTHVGILGKSFLNLANDFSRAIRNQNIPIIEFQSNGKIDFRCLRYIRKYIDEQGIEIVHSHGYKSDIYAFFSVFWNKRPIQLVASSHTWKLSTCWEKMYKLVDLYILKRFNKVVAISNEIRIELLKSGIDENRILIIYNGIDVNISDNQILDSNQLLLEKSANSVFIGTVSSLTVEKAQHDLIAAFSQIQQEFSEVRLIIVGDGNQRDLLENQVKERGLVDKVLFTGYRKDVNQLYKLFDIFALVSYSEGLPMAMLEAMACRIPVVVSRVGAIPDVINDRENGLLIDAGNIRDIASSLRLLIENPALMKAMGERGRETIVSRYSSNRMAQEYQKIYDEVLFSS